VICPRLAVRVAEYTAVRVLEQRRLCARVDRPATAEAPRLVGGLVAALPGALQGVASHKQRECGATRRRRKLRAQMQTGTSYVWEKGGDGCLWLPNVVEHMCATTM
jgi:hypothetical protein